jgi:hypothetical protein
VNPVPNTKRQPDIYAIKDAVAAKEFTHKLFFASSSQLDGRKKLINFRLDLITYHSLFSLTRDNETAKNLLDYSHPVGRNNPAALSSMMQRASKKTVRKNDETKQSLSNKSENECLFSCYDGIFSFFAT